VDEFAAKVEQTLLRRQREASPDAAF